MGWKYEVEFWTLVDTSNEYGWVYETAYTGESLVAALRAMRRAKRHSGCVRLSWR